MKMLTPFLLSLLLLVGCGDEVSQITESGAESNKAQNQQINLDDPATRNKVLAQAIDENILQVRGKKGDELAYSPNSEEPYTGWAKAVRVDGEENMINLSQYKTGKRHGLATLWRQNGKKYGQSFYNEGKRHGLATGWYQNGQKIYEIDFEDDAIHGLETRWHENGQKRSETNYKDGKRHGLRSTWYGNGQKERESNWTKDRPHGLSTWWDKNGQKLWEASYEESGHHSLQTWFHANGKKRYIINYKHGKQHGLSTKWDEDGNVTSQTKWENGKEVGYGLAESDAQRRSESNARAWHKNYTGAPYLSGDQFFKKVRNVRLSVSASPHALEKISSKALLKEIENLVRSWGLTLDSKSVNHLHIDVNLRKARWEQTLTQGYRVTQRSTRTNYALSVESMVTVPAVVYLDGGFHGMRVSPRGAYVYGPVKQPEIQSTAQFAGLLRKYMGELKKSMQSPKYSKPPAVHYWPESEAATRYLGYLAAASKIAPFGESFLRKGRTVRDVSASYKASLRRSDARSKYPLIDENALRNGWRADLNAYGMKVTGKGPISQSHDVGLYFGAAANASQLLFSGELDFFYAYYSRVHFSMQNCVYLFEGKFYRGKANLFDHSKILPLRSKQLKTDVFGEARKHREQILRHHTTPP